MWRTITKMINYVIIGATGRKKELHFQNDYFGT